MNYTMFIGKIGSDPLTVANPEVRYGQSFFTEDKIIIFDIIDNYSISLQNEKTQYAIESRSSISDHIFSPDGKFSFTGRIMSSPVNIRSEYNEWDINTNKSNLKESLRAKRAYDVLVAARDAKTNVTLDFEEGILNNYVITSINMTRDSSIDQLTVSIDLEEMRTVTVGKTVLAVNVGSELENDAAGNKNKGQVSADADGKAEGQVDTTKNINSRSTEFYKSQCAAGITGMCPDANSGEYLFDASKFGKTE